LAIAIGLNGTVVVADTYNDRLLIWTSFPTFNAEPASFEIRTPALRWPWGAWTDGERLVVSSTGGRSLLFWNIFPTTTNHPPNFVLRPEGMGTPRTITSDEQWLIVGDHNAFERRRRQLFLAVVPA
jgi:hypothetical protein